MKNRRIYTLMFLLFMGWFALVAKVFSVQVIQSKEYTELAEKQAMRRKILHPSRGEIHDRNGKKMAINAEVDVNYQEGNEKISRQLRRVLPFGHTAGQLIGNVGNEGYGQVGIEYSMDRTLRGEDGWEYMRITVQKKYHPDFKEQRREPVHGKTIVLSIDVELQKIAELALERGIQRVGAIDGSVVLIDPYTGDILAMANYPFYDPNRRMSQDIKNAKNDIVSKLYEPGSTFKVVTVSTVIQENLVKPTDVFSGENGVYRYGVALIKDSHPHDVMTLCDGLAYSSNIVMVKATDRLDPKVFYKYIRSFGLGIKTGIPLPGEESGVFKSTEEWNSRSKATLSWGQELSATPLQIAMMGAVIANGGMLLKPRLVLGYKDIHNEWTEKLKVQEIRRVLTEETTLKVKNMMRSVVQYGTAKGIDSPNFEISGKTGTVEKIDEETGRYVHGKFHSSFLGMVPTQKPRFVGLVLVNEPKLDKHGSKAAAPIFKEIVDRAASMKAYADILEPAINSDSVPLASHPKVEVHTSGVSMPTFNSKPINSAIDSSEKYSLEKGNITMPNLTNLSLRDALYKMSKFPIKISYTGQGKVKAQNPAPYTPVVPGTKCQLVLSWGEESL